MEIGSQSELSSWLLNWFANTGGEEREAMIQAVYALWLARNEAREGRRIAPPHDIIATLVAHMEEWRLAHTDTAKPPDPKVIQRWQPPDVGWIKANSDGAVSKFGDKGGGGLVLRDHNGAFVAGASHFYPHNVDPKAVEILTCRRVVQLAREMNVQKLHMELDNQKVVQMLKLLSKNLSATGPWIEEIKEQFQGFEEVKVSWVRRSANVAAHKFARLGVGDEPCKVWLSVPPDFVLDVISDEIPNF